MDLSFAEQLPEMTPMILISSIFLDQKERSCAKKLYILFTFINFQNIGSVLLMMIGMALFF